MSFRSRLREARQRNGVTQEQLGVAIGVAKSTITSYESGNSEPDIYKMKLMMDFLGIDPNYLLQDEMKGARNQFEVSFSERAHIEKYRNLDDHGKEAVDSILDIERKRMTRLSRDEIADIVEAELRRQDQLLESKDG